MATIDLGKIKQVWRGTYNNGTAYTVDDLVAYTDSGILSTYICVANSTGNAPSSSGSAHASWNYVAKGVVDPIPSQSGNSGKALITNGSSVSWGQAGTWTKIAGGTGPSTDVDAFSIDNIFSDSYKFYKVFYSFAETEWIKMRYIKADGSVDSNSNYTWTVGYGNEDTDEYGRSGANGTNYGVYHYWNGADNAPALCEITLYHPFASSYKTGDMARAVSLNGAQLCNQYSANIVTTAYSARGIYVWHTGSGSQLGNDFYYLVLGAN